MSWGQRLGPLIETERERAAEEKAVLDERRVQQEKARRKEERAKEKVRTDDRESIPVDIVGLATSIASAVVAPVNEMAVLQAKKAELHRRVMSSEGKPVLAVEERKVLDDLAHVKWQISQLAAMHNMANRDRRHRRASYAEMPNL